MADLALDRWETWVLLISGIAGVAYVIYAWATGGTQAGTFAMLESLTGIVIIGGILYFWLKYVTGEID